MNPRHLLCALVLASTSLACPAVDAVPDCKLAPEHRQFDFWIGDWEVFDPKGKKVGDNSITAAKDGCSLFESWRGNGNVAGNSTNRFLAATKAWRQTWVDNQGGVLDLTGQLKGTSMVLEGVDLDESVVGGARRQRITWTPLAGGQVRQLWEVSGDGGKSWKVEFDGRYVRKAP